MIHQGYLVAATVAHPVEWYPSRGQAYFGIQVRCFAALVGVCTLALETFVVNSVSMLQSQPGASKFSGRGAKHEDQVAWVFMTKVSVASAVCRRGGLFVEVVFILGLCLDVYAACAHALDFKLFTLASAFVVFLTGYMMWGVYGELRRAKGTMGYYAPLFEDFASNNSGLWGPKITYLDGVMQPQAGTIGSSHSHSHHGALVGSSVI